MIKLRILEEGKKLAYKYVHEIFDAKAIFCKQFLL